MVWRVNKTFGWRGRGEKSIQNLLVQVSFGPKQSIKLTLGAGDMAVFLNDSLHFIHNYRFWEILDNGPLRSTFRVRFDPYTFDGITVNEVRTVSLDHN